MERPSVSIVIPAHNEEDNLRVVISESLAALQASTHDHEVIVVDDASTDRTWELAQELAAERPEVRALHSPLNIGTYGVVKMGLAAARCDLLFFVPADLQVRPDQLRVCLSALRTEHADYVCTDRVHRVDPWHRRLMARSYNAAVRRLFGLQLHDVDSVFLLRRSVFEAIAPQLGSDTDFLPVEMIVRAARLGYRITETPVEHYARTAGSPSAIKPRAVLRTLARMMRFQREMRRLQRSTLP